ncbi:MULTISPECIES: ABC transporter ATP-binding protein [unclassified Synechocystis]|uniref:ABC transporter ATP-binding protein n=1 Tax=unclassified Synechocystis TaxID=2640012 RepID=UPI00041C3CFB|nr:MULTISPECIES: ABC transporter ATP-binding protein [unclassified Synechocystis]AIE75723.1 ABC transporter [Synechocystis sp. PCC 6714]MCT0252446.1 ABC transporter ATP-binding protein [Synechocystis sp. CS-94]
MNAPTPILNAQNLSKTYATPWGTVDAVKDVSLSLLPGQFTAIIGRSGSGKSSLLAMLSGLSRPTRGLVEIHNTNLWELSAHQRAEMRNRSFGFVFQFASLLPTLRAIDNVALPALLGTKINSTMAYDRAALLLEQVGLVDRSQAYPDQLSGGEQRRVAIARALINGPPLLMADEPTGDLDEKTELGIIALLIHICRSQATSLVIVTHNLSLTQYANQVLTLQGGELTTVKQEIKADQKVHIPPPELPEVLPTAVPISLGTNLGINRRKLLWFLPIVPVAWGLDTAVAWYQQRIMAIKKQAFAQLYQATHGYLYIDIQNVAYEPDGKSYRLTMVMQNLDQAHPLYIQILPMRAFVQKGFTWEEIPTNVPKDSKNSLIKLTTQTTFETLFTPNVPQPTELIPGYMHVRIDTDLLVSQRSQPEDDLINRSDPYYFYLKPHNADDAEILRHSHYPGQPPVYISMPPH